MSSFYERVYTLVRSIPPGKVCTYGQIAVMAGSPGAARQVGWAMAGLPHGSDVPWHRVINAKGGISIRGRMEGADLQRILLEREGVRFDDNGRTDLREFQYIP